MVGLTSVHRLRRLVEWFGGYQQIKSASYTEGREFEPRLHLYFACKPAMLIKTALVLCYRPPSFDNEFCLNNTLHAVHHECDNVSISRIHIDWSGNENTPNLGSYGSVCFLR